MKIISTIILGLFLSININAQSKAESVVHDSLTAVDIRIQINNIKKLVDFYDRQYKNEYYNYYENMKKLNTQLIELNNKLEALGKRINSKNEEVESE